MNSPGDVHLNLIDGHWCTAIDAQENRSPSDHDDLVGVVCPRICRTSTASGHRSRGNSRTGAGGHVAEGAAAPPPCGFDPDCFAMVGERDHSGC